MKTARETFAAWLPTMARLMIMSFLMLHMCACEQGKQDRAQHGGNGGSGKGEPPAAVSTQEKEGEAMGDNGDLAKRAQQASVKGMELVSWEVDHVWHFSLVGGTNRKKAVHEYLDASAEFADIKELKRRLAQLAKGENVIWFIPQQDPAARFDFPAPAIIKDVEDYCKAIDVELVVLR